MKIIVAAVGAAAILAAGQPELHRIERTWSQTRDGFVWTLSVIVKETTGPHRWPAELVRFTVRRDGVFLHCSSSLDGGRLAGMKYYVGAGSSLSVEDLPPQGGPGWILHVLESAGNVHSLRACVVAPRVAAYDAVVISTKNRLVQRVCADHVELWGSYQEWGGGGTSSSVFVPFRLVAGRERSLRREPLSSDPAEPLEFVDDGGFSGIFIAGMRERNPDLMQVALDRLFVEPEEEASPTPGGLGLPARRAVLQVAVENVRKVAEARRALQLQMESLALDDPLPIGLP